MAKFGMGQPLRRREDRRFLAGRGGYVDDLQIDGAKHLIVLRSPHAHARIVDMDVGAAMAMSGVAVVLTGNDLNTDGIGSIPCMGAPESFGDRESFMPAYPVLAPAGVEALDMPATPEKVWRALQSARSDG